MKGKYEHCRNLKYAQRVMIGYWKRYAGPELIRRDFEGLARCHNAGANWRNRRRSTDKYWLGVKNHLKGHQMTISEHIDALEESIRKLREALAMMRSDPDSKAKQIVPELGIEIENRAGDIRDLAVGTSRVEPLIGINDGPLQRHFAGLRRRIEGSVERQAKKQIEAERAPKFREGDIVTVGDREDEWEIIAVGDTYCWSRSSTGECAHLNIRFLTLVRRPFKFGDKVLTKGHNDVWDFVGKSPYSPNLLELRRGNKYVYVEPEDIRHVDLP